jgi:hypothetical protein
MRKLVKTHLVLSKRQRKFTATDLVCSHLAMRCAEGFAGSITVGRSGGCAGGGAGKDGAVSRLGQPP